MTLPTKFFCKNHLPLKNYFDSTLTELPTPKLLHGSSCGINFFEFVALHGSQADVINRIVFDGKTHDDKFSAAKLKRIFVKCLVVVIGERANISVSRKNFAQGVALPNTFFGLDGVCVRRNTRDRAALTVTTTSLYS